MWENCQNIFVENIADLALLLRNTVAEQEQNYFYAHPEKILKTLPRISSKIGATLKGKNSLPEGANSFLLEQPLWYRIKMFYVNVT